jgi:hypothetical protein
MATFTKGATTIQITATLYPVKYEGQRNQNFGEAEDGTIRVYDRNVKVEFLHLQIKEDHTNMAALRYFIMSTVKLRKDTFTFNPDSDQDAGNGEGGPITVRYWDSNFIEEQYIYHRYKYSLLLRREIA